MRKAEIDRKFDEIVAFAEIEQFLDTPVKRYSSGMYVRLAFAVAAHLEPEILIVDEVLAVGDFAFQKKCLGKMHDVATGDGRTILFVSHNIGALAQLCDRGILLENGTVTTIGPIQDVIEHYLKSGLDSRDGPGPLPRRSRQALPVPLGGDPPRRRQPGDGFQLRRAGQRSALGFEIREPVPGACSSTSRLPNLDGIRVLFSDIRDSDPSITERLGVGLHTFEIRIPGPAAGADDLSCMPHRPGRPENPARSSTPRDAASSRSATW